MTTLLRLLKFVHRLNACSSKTTLIKINFENLSTNALLHPQTVFLSNQYKNYVSLVGMRAKNIDQENEIDTKMRVLNKEINKYGRITKFRIDDILKDIKISGTVTNLQGLFLLRCCSELIDDKSPAMKRQLGDDIWKALKELGIELDVSHYNALLSIYLENEYDFSPLGFLEDMVNANVKPNKVTFQRLISQFCNQGKITEAKQIMDYMKNEQIPVNENTLSSLIWGHSIKNDMEAVLKTIKDMESLDIIPTIRTYSTLMYAYARNGDIESINKTLAECKDKDIWIPDKVLLTIIYHLSLNGFTEHVDEIISLTSKGTSYVKDANKIMYKLVEKQQENVAFKIFQTMPKDAINRALKSGDFLIQTLIDFKSPVDKSIEYCRIMEKEGVHQRAFMRAIQKSLANDMFQSSISFMKAWKEIGGLVREHYFYPIFKAYGKDGQCECIEKVLQTMILEFNINPSIYTLKSLVLPYMNGSSYEMLTSLMNSHVQYSIALHGILLHLLSENKIREATKFMSVNYGFQFKTGIIKYSLLQAFKNTEDAPSFVWILHYIYKTVLDESSVKDEDIDNKYLAQQFIDSCILEAIDLMPASNKYLQLMLFRNLVDKGLSISDEAAEGIVNKLNNNMNLQSLNYLEAMKSGNLILKPIHKEDHIGWTRKLTDIDKLESTAKVLTFKNNKEAWRIKKRLVLYYCLTMNEKRIDELLEDFETTGTNISIWYCISLINMYLNLQKIDKAEFWIYKSKKQIPDFQLIKMLNLKLVTRLVEAGQIEKALEYLACPTLSSSFHSWQNCRKLLVVVSKLNDEELLQRFFDLLNEHGYISEKRSALFEPFIQMYLDRGDGAAAMHKFKWVYETHQQISCNIALMKKFIKDGEDSLMEDIKIICVNVVGKSRTYFDLAVAHLENDNLAVARDILENHCTNIYEEHVMYIAEKYYKSGEVNYLEKLFEVLNSLKYDVEKLCVLLLKSYSMQREWRKGYDLWIRMQEDGIKPSRTFINCLNLILKNKNNEENDSLQKCINAIRDDDIIKATLLLDSLPLVYKSDCYSTLCKIYVTRNDVANVLDLWQDLSQRFHLDLDLSVAKYILSKLVAGKDIESIEKIKEYLSPQTKKELNYNKYLNQAYLHNGTWNIYLRNLQYKLDNDLVTWKNLDMHNKTVIYSLIKYPELCEQFEDLAYKFSERNILAPMHALWAYYFLEKNAKADEIWVEYIRNQPLFLWLEVINFRKFNDDINSYLKLAELVHQSSLKHKDKIIVYSNLIRNCIQLENPKKYEYGLKCLQHAMLESFMGEFNISLLVDLQTGLEKSGLSWPWSAQYAQLNTSDMEASKKLIKDILM